ncbi:MAG: hypothetical protein II604_03855 [Bacteroidales bacterium]|nr:hypothetical protein [Bacteroidales bacterium]
MNKRKQLYIKNEKGRYEPYTPDVDLHTAYRKVGKNKYVPFATMYHEDWLNDGVFVVRCDRSAGLRSFSEIGYLNDVFRIDKVGNNYRILADQLASLQDYTEFCMSELRKFEQERNDNIGVSPFERTQVIVGSVFKFSQILKEKIEKEKTNKRDGSDGNYPPF